MKFRKKPVVIEALQFTKIGNPLVMRGFMGGTSFEFTGNKLCIPTLEGTMAANYGDWIIKGINGEFYPCKPDIFEKTYDRIEE